MKGDIVVISDLHLGDVRIHAGVQAALVDFLENFVVKEADQLVILGDCFEMAQYMIREIWFRSEEVLRALFSLLKRVRVTFVVGNHDFFLKEFAGEYPSFDIVYPDYTFEQSGRKFYMEHGHRYQREYLKNPPLYNALATAGRLLDFLPPEVEDVGGGLFLKLKELASRQKGTSQKSGDELQIDLDEFRAAAARRLTEGYDCVLFGHTHKPLVERLQEGFYVNTGDWVVHMTYTVLRQGVPIQREWEVVE